MCLNNANVNIINLALTQKNITCLFCPPKDKPTSVIFTRHTMACTECRKAKSACVKVAGSNKCKRCIDKKSKCHPHISKQGRRTDLRKDESPLPQRIHCSSQLRHDESPAVSDVDSVEILKRRDLRKDESPLPQRIHCLSQLGYDESPAESDADSVEILDVFSQGQRPMWSISNNSSLAYETITSRVALKKEGLSTYLICTCVPNLPQGASGCFSVFRQKCSQSWHLAIVESFFYLQHDGPDKIHLFQWTGKLSSVGSPAFYIAESWEELKEHFTKKVFNLNDIDFFFVNKVRGITFPNETISDNTRSEKDGGIQCNPSGPDQLPTYIIMPTERINNMNENLATLSISPGIHPFFQKNNLGNTLRQRTTKRKKVAPAS